MTRWAITGTGYITNRFAQGMQQVKDADLCAVVSRNEEKAKAFAKKYGADAFYTDFGKMLADAKPDIVYLGIPNDCHYAYIMQALDAGIPVLSEKPMTDTTAQMENVFAKALEKNLFVMEGMWTRCFPVVKKVREWIEDGKIGDPLTVNVSFDMKPDFQDWQPWKGGLSHAGGSLRDVGIYSLGVANMVFPGAPEQVITKMHLQNEVDYNCRLLLDYGQGRIAYAGGAFDQNGDSVARITGSEGRISFGPEFWHPFSAELVKNDGTGETFTCPYEATGFQYEIMEVQKALAGSLKECPLFTHEESLTISRIIEASRKEYGIFYKADAAT